MTDQLDDDLDLYDHTLNVSNVYNAIDRVNNLLTCDLYYERLLERTNREKLEIDELMHSSEQLLERLDRERLEIDELIQSSNDLIESIHDERLDTERMLPTEMDLIEMDSFTGEETNFELTSDDDSEFGSEFESDFESDSDSITTFKVASLRINARSNLYRGPVPLDSVQKYKQKDCSICQEKISCQDQSKSKTRITITISDCDHVFHSVCIDKWIESKNFNGCPECRGGV